MTKKKARLAKKRKPKTSVSQKLEGKYRLYERAVQNVEYEAQLISRIYKKYRDETPLVMREDFCGTFALSCAWLKASKKPKSAAIAVDIDPKVLQWGVENNLNALTADQQKALHLFNDNVINVSRPPCDICVAFNFSYWIFTERKTLLTYFENVLRSLKTKGVFVVDAYGGSEAEIEKKEYRKEKDFTFIWEQRKFYPGTREMDCRIHFLLHKKKQQMNNAFRYFWRLWTPPEITEALLTAGFQAVDWYYEDSDRKTGEGTGKFRLSKNGRGSNAETWIGYAVACK